MIQKINMYTCHIFVLVREYIQISISAGGKHSSLEIVFATKDLTSGCTSHYYFTTGKVKLAWQGMWW
jgi:hypothetical protein